jgi:hypothetical protein
VRRRADAEMLDVSGAQRLRILGAKKEKPPIPVTPIRVSFSFRRRSRERNRQTIGCGERLRPR